MDVYILQNTYDGDKPRVFRSRHDAEREAVEVRRRLHREYCVERHVGVGPNCLCVRSNGAEQCAAHDYAENVEDHRLSECEVGSEENVYVEEAEME